MTYTATYSKIPVFNNFGYYLCIFFTLILILLANNFVYAEKIPISLEIAKTSQDRTWGLMKRSSMPKDHGMLFYYPQGAIWMFNTWMDLSIAFLNKEGRIIEIVELASYPEMMDPTRPVNNLNDMKKYPCHDRIYQFFQSKSYPIPEKTAYALEMNKAWFNQHAVKKGDQLFWSEGSNRAYISKD